MSLKNKLLFRHQVNSEIRNYLSELNFVDVETPYLIKSSPEGARDFVGALKDEFWKILCLTTISANFQTITDGWRIRSIFSNCKMF